MFYKSEKVLSRLIVSSVFSTLGVLSIGVGLLYKFVFNTTDKNLSNLVIIILSIIGCLLLFIAFILGIFNQVYLQKINNSLLEENKKQWEKQLKDEINDSNNDFILADEVSEKPEVHEDEVININIVNDAPTPIQTLENNIPEIIVNVDSTKEEQPIVEAVDQNIGISDKLNNKNTFVKINNEENIPNIEQENTQDVLPSEQLISYQQPIIVPSRIIPNQENNIEQQQTTMPQPPHRPINIFPRTIPNQENNVSENVNIQQQVNTFTIPPRNSYGTIPQRTIPNSNITNFNNQERSIPPRSVPSATINNQNINQPQQRTIPQRPNHIPPRM